jgi:PAS domain S-box-containing protein
MGSDSTKAFSPDGSQPDASQNEQRLRLLVETGILLASERSLDVIVQAALDAGLHLCSARYGAFFYNNIGDHDKSYSLYKVAGPDIDIFTAFPDPLCAEIPKDSFLNQLIVRSPDITLDPRYSETLPFAGVPPNQLPIRSYLSVPVRSRAGESLGCLLYGHPDPGNFSPDTEDLVATIASQAAVAIDNLRLSENLNYEIAQVDAARALQRETSERLRQALDAAQLGTWIWDRATDIIDLDERAGALFHAEPHVPITRTELRKRAVAVEDQAYASENLQQFLETGGIYSAEYRVESVDGIRTWVSASGNATFAPNGTDIIGMVGTVQDITNRKIQESALRQSEKLAATGRLAATIAHEINNPLEAVTNLIYLSRTDPDVPEPVQQLLETADTELARVAQIAQQTLGFYRDTTRPVEINLTDLIHSVVDLFERKMISSRIDCTLDLEPGLCIHGLQGEMRQVFSNLVVNAIDASASVEKPCRIHVRARHRSGQRNGVSILVSDQGSGIPPEVRTRIFSPFFTTKQSIGTGLGLWVTRGFVEKQGGSIRFRSRTDTPSGTIFRVYLPASASHVQ